MTDVTLHYAVPIEASSPPESLPSVCAVIPTRNRPELLRRAVLGALEQDYAGDLQVIVVLDQADANALERLPASPRIKVLTNTRKAGLAGARNTGIMASTADLIAFCDDDDAWRPNKIANQVDALLAQPSANFVSCSIEVDFEGKRSVRLAGANRITHAELRSSRMSMLHSSTFLIRREALLGDLGLIDEGIPGSHNEDWDVLLRASRLSPIVHVDQPLVQVQWTSGSHFNRAWDQKIASLQWILDRHPDIVEESPKGAARVYGQIAFAYAASGERTTALRWAGRAIRRRWREPRAYLAIAVAGGIPAETVLSTLHRRGKGV